MVVERKASGAARLVRGKPVASGILLPEASRVETGGQFHELFSMIGIGAPILLWRSPCRRLPGRVRDGRGYNAARNGDVFYKSSRDHSKS